MKKGGVGGHLYLSSMYRVRLTGAQREELKRMAHEPEVKPRTRDRLEMARLSDAGWSIPALLPIWG